MEYSSTFYGIEATYQCDDMYHFKRGVKQRVVVCGPEMVWLGWQQIKEGCSGKVDI